MFGCETRTISLIEKSKLKAFAKIPTDRNSYTNKEVLNRIKKKMTIMEMYIHSNRDKMKGHKISRRKNLLIIITIDEDVEGYAKRGRPRAEYMTQISKDVNRGQSQDSKRTRCTRQGNMETTATKPMLI